MPVNPEIVIGNKKVGPNHPPFFIAEMSGNHKGSLDLALEIVDAAADAGADALKLQTYSADTMTLDVRKEPFLISEPDSPWTGRTLYDLYKEASTPWEWHEPIFKRCRERGILGFSSPFDFSAIDYLSRLGVPAYKIASLENYDMPLILRAAEQKKPLIISTGASLLEELTDMVAKVKAAGFSDLILLKCTSSYPAKAEDANLKTIPDLASRFGVITGISDHTLGIGVSLAAIALGACVVEKHLTLSRAAGGVDAFFSLEPGEFKQMVSEGKEVWKSLGTINYLPTASERGLRKYKRSLFFVRDIPAGGTIHADSVRSIRPSSGLPPMHFNEIVGKRAKSAITKGTPVSWDLIEK